MSKWAQQPDRPVSNVKLALHWKYSGAIEKRREDLAKMYTREALVSTPLLPSDWRDRRGLFWAVGGHSEQGSLPSSQQQASKSLKSDDATFRMVIAMKRRMRWERSKIQLET